MNKLFQKAKLAVKFRRAGDGHSLSESSSSTNSNQPEARQEPRKAPTSDAQRAGQAALARFDQQEKVSRRPQSATATWKSSGTSSSSQPDPNFVKLRNEVKAEIGKEMLLSEPIMKKNKENEVIRQDSAPVLAVSGVFFKCPFCSVSFPRQDVNEHMEECLTKSLANDPTLTPVNMIRTLNKDQTKVQSCVDIICRYFDNILQNPDEEKYRRIKKGNKVFQERVSHMKGTTEFLLSCGFVEKPLPDNQDEMCFMLEEMSPEVLEKLTVMKDILLGTERSRPKLDRSLKILQPTSDEQILELPDDFFEFSSEEVKKMQNERTEELERNSQLRTRAMREKEAKNPTRIYRFTLLRVRFPDQVILQVQTTLYTLAMYVVFNDESQASNSGTFHAREKASSLISFVREQLQCDWLPFVLAESGGRQLTQEESSFAELGLVPAAILNFTCDPSIIEDIKAGAGTATETSIYLKSELLEQFKNLQTS